MFEVRSTKDTLVLFTNVAVIPLTDVLLSDSSSNGFYCLVEVKQYWENKQCRLDLIDLLHFNPAGYPTRHVVTINLYTLSPNSGT